MKPAIAGAVLFILWLVGMVAWGSVKNIEPDFRGLEAIGETEDMRSFGHPLWNE